VARSGLRKPHPEIWQCSQATVFARFKFVCPSEPADRKVKVFSPDGVIASLIADLLCMR
jgi:hypothetical protein